MFIPGVRRKTKVTPCCQWMSFACFEKIVNSNLPNCKSVSLLISVSKRHFKHAVDRNRAKRLIREAYRLNKGLLLDHLPEDTQLDLAFIWMSDELCDYAIIETKMKTILQRIAEKINGRDSE